MAKKTADETEGDQTTHVAMKKSDFDACKVRYTSTNKKIEDERTVLNEYLAEAKKERRLHPQAFKDAMKILKMEEPKRGEYLFQLGTYLKFLKVFDQADMLADRQPPEGDDDKRDMRPRHLREAESQISEAAGKAHKGSEVGDDEGDGANANDLTHH